MATILIRPIACVTVKGYAAEITGISPGLTDQLVGTVTTNVGTLNVCWDIHGKCRNQTPDLDLDMKNHQVAEVVDLAEGLSKLTTSD